MIQQPHFWYIKEKTYLNYVGLKRKKSCHFWKNMDETLCFSEIAENIVFSEISQTEDWYHLYVELF